MKANVHHRVCAWLHLLLGLLTLGSAAIAGIVFGLMGGVAGGAIGAESNNAMPGILGFFGVGGIVFLLIAIFALPNIIAAWGLFIGAEWGRIVAIVVSFITLMHPSFGLGTALAIYSLVVLLAENASDRHPSPPPTYD